METRATVTVEEAGRILGIGRASAYEGIKKGQIPAIRVGRRLVVPRTALERLLAGEAARSAQRSQEADPV
jgi:excisionase family DNA binding protein